MSDKFIYSCDIIVDSSSVRSYLATKFILSYFSLNVASSFSSIYNSCSNERPFSVYLFWVLSWSIYLVIFVSIVRTN